MMHSSSSENAMLATVNRLRRLLRNADLATKLERVIGAKTFYAVPSFLGGAFGRARTPGAPFDILAVLRYYYASQQNTFLSSRRNIFPDGVRGTTSTKRISLGCLCRESRSATKLRNSRSRASEGKKPSRSTTKAHGISPAERSGFATTPQSRTAGCSSSKASTSAGATGNPLYLIIDRK